MHWISQHSDLMGLILAAIAIIVAVFIAWLQLGKKERASTATKDSSNQDASPGTVTPSVGPSPQLAASTSSVFLVHVLNAASSPLDTARSVVAHIGYKRRDGRGICVDYGAWMEGGTITNIEGGQTKNLVVALTNDGKNFAVNWTGPRTNLIDAKLVPVGELTPGQWMMVVTINAENYEKIFTFSLTIEQNGAIECEPVKRSLR